jgi:hypothetical protein
MKAIRRSNTPRRFAALDKDKIKAEKNPAALGSRLTLPAGWKFRVKDLDRDLMVSQEKTGTLAHVMQDDLLNRYQGSDGGKAFNYVP